jgi:CRP-like cAMP-binding protein
MRDNAQAVAPLERLLHLKKLPALATLPSTELTAIAEYMTERFFPKGGLVYRDGEPIGAVYFLLEGEIAVRRRGRELGHMGPGSPVGGLGLFARDEEGVEATAVTDTLALELDADAILEIFEDRFPILLHVVQDSSRRLIDLVASLGLDPGDGAPALEPLPESKPELDLVERIFQLRRIPLFQKGNINALAELSRGLAQVRFEPRTLLWRAGEPSQSIFLILSGTVGVRVPPGGRGFRVGPGFPMGALEAVAETPRWYDAATETAVVALQGSEEGLLDLFEDNFEMAMDYLAVMSRWLLELLERFASGDLERLYGIQELPTVEAHREPPSAPPEPATT